MKLAIFAEEGTKKRYAKQISNDSDIDDVLHWLGGRWLLVETLTDNGIIYESQEVHRLPKPDLSEPEKQCCDRCEGKPFSMDAVLCSDCYTDLHGM